MAPRESGIRERVSRALMVSAAVYAVAIGIWAIQTRQLSEASPSTTATKTTISFEEQQAPRLLGTQGTYEYAAQGVVFTDDGGNSNATAALSKEGAQCNGGLVYTGEQLATSGSNRLHPYPSVSSPLVISFTNNRVSNDVSFQLLGVGDAKNVVEFFDHNGTTIETKEFVNTGAGVGCDKKELVSLSAPNIAKIRITQPQNANGDDGLAIDDLSFASLTDPVDTSLGTLSVSPASGTAPLTITATYTPPAGGTTAGLSWNFGDGTNTADTAAVQQHTYAAAGSYTVILKKGTETVGTQIITVTAASTEVAATLTTSKSNYPRNETVQFTLKNTGSLPIQLKNGAPFSINRGVETVYTPTATLAIETLAAGQSKTWTWDQATDNGTPAEDGSYVVTVNFTANSQEYGRSAAFSIEGTTSQTGTFGITPTSGTIPLTTTLTCTGDTIRDIVVDWGDGNVTSGVTCPTSLIHTYTHIGEYTITLRQGTTILGSQKITALASASDGKGTPPTRLASTGASLVLMLIIATVIAGLGSYLIIRRPFHGQSQ